MAWLSCRFHSNTLDLQTGLQIILPDADPPAEMPVVWLLHGLSDDCTGWLRLTGAERYAVAHRAALVMPEVQRSFYTDMAFGLDYFTYVSEELPAFCRRLFSFSAAREKNYVMGLSMGGYGAMKCVLTFPERYAGCAAFSSAAEPVGFLAQHPEYRREAEAVYGHGFPNRPENDLSALAERAAGAQKKPSFYLTCGSEDGLYASNKKIFAQLQSCGFAPKFEEWPGGHSWDFWDESLRRALELFFGNGAAGGQ